MNTLDEFTIHSKQIFGNDTVIIIDGYVAEIKLKHLLEPSIVIRNPNEYQVSYNHNFIATEMLPIDIKRFIQQWRDFYHFRVNIDQVKISYKLTDMPYPKHPVGITVYYHGIRWTVASIVTSPAVETYCYTWE